MTLFKRDSKTPVKTKEGRGGGPFLPFLVVPARFLDSENWKCWECPETTVWGGYGGGGPTRSLQTAAVDKGSKLGEDEGGCHDGHY